MFWREQIHSDIVCVCQGLKLVYKAGALLWVSEAEVCCVYLPSHGSVPFHLFHLCLYFFSLTHTHRQVLWSAHSFFSKIHSSSFIVLMDMFFGCPVCLQHLTFESHLFTKICSYLVSFFLDTHAFSSGSWWDVHVQLSLSSFYFMGNLWLLLICWVVCSLRSWQYIYCISYLVRSLSQIESCHIYSCMSWSHG